MDKSAKSLLVIIDGLGDEVNNKTCGLTPWEFASTPYMEKLVAIGNESCLSICEEDLAPESCGCILRLLGVKVKYMPKNRAYLELLAHNRNITEAQQVLRCNLAVKDVQGKLVAFNAQGLDKEQMQDAALLCRKLCKGAEFIHLSEYRNLLIIQDNKAVLDCKIKPPHESIGECVERLLADIRGISADVADFLDAAEKNLSIFVHDDLHYILYPWGASPKQALPSFVAMHQKSGGVVCRTEIVVGIAKALAMEIVIPAGTTGDVDTNVDAKLGAALELLQRHDFVLVHFNGSDEAAHRLDALGKTKFIEKIDREFIGKLMKTYDRPLKIVICGDHVTSSVTGKHGSGTVPVVAAALNCAVPVPVMKNYKDILSFLLE